MTPLRKILDLAVNKHGLKDPAFAAPLPLDEPAELTHGMKDLEDIRSQYEGLLTNGQVIAVAAYDLSRAIQDMASFILEGFTQFLDSETENVFNMLSKVQYELSKLLDLFASHVSQTIITPTEMMMNELQLVQVMKDQYDEKRHAYNKTLTELQKVKTSGKSDNVNLRLGLAKEDFKDQAYAVDFRLQSLKQGHCRSLITQVARYHSAQMHFFSNGLASVSALEPIMKQIASEKNVDRHLQEGDFVSDTVLDFSEWEDYASVTGGESERLTGSPSACEMFERSDVIFSTVSNSKPSPRSSSFYEKDDHIAESTNNKFSMYVLPTPSNAAQRNNSLMKGNEGGVQHDVTQPLFSQEPRVDSEIQTSDERSCLLNYSKVGLPGSFQKIGRSLSHSGTITNRHVMSNRHGNVFEADMDFHVELRDPLYKSGPIAVRASQLARTVSSALLSPPQVNELHKLPLPLSPNLRSTHNSPNMVKKPQELLSQKSMVTSPLPDPPGLGAWSLSMPASIKDLEFRRDSQKEATKDSKLHPHSEVETQNNVPFLPAFQSIGLPVVTASMLH